MNYDNVKITELREEQEPEMDTSLSPVNDQKQHLK